MNLCKLSSWHAPSSWKSITTIDAHTCGQPLRIYMGGFPTPPGNTILARRQACREQFDSLRTATMWEPRGHADMYGCLITPPERTDSHFGVLFTHNEGYSSMCGHGIIAVATVAVMTGMIERQEKETEIRIDTPAGLITAWVQYEGDQVQSVRFHNVPSFVAALDQVIEVPGLGTVRYDLAFGGAYYALVDAGQLALSTAEDNSNQLIDLGRRIKHVVAEALPIEHPVDADLSFLYGTIFTSPPQNTSSDRRNVCIFADGELDRSPTGTGVSARVAADYARGLVSLNEARVYESIIGSQMRGKAVKTLNYGPHTAIIPEVEGRAFITGRHEFLLDPKDPLLNGFLLR